MTSNTTPTKPEPPKKPESTVAHPRPLNSDDLKEIESGDCESDAPTSQENRPTEETEASDEQATPMVEEVEVLEFCRRCGNHGRDPACVHCGRDSEVLAGRRPPPKPEPKKRRRRFTSVTRHSEIRVPLASRNPEHNMGGVHVDLHLTPTEAEVLRELAKALDEGGRTLANGRRITTRPDALRWLMQEIGKRNS